MPDGSRWGVPVEIIARDRAKHYASEFGGDIERSLAEDTKPLFESDDFEIIDWAQNNMNWSDVKDHAGRMADSEPEPPDYQDGWVNGEKELVLSTVRKGHGMDDLENTALLGLRAAQALAHKTATDAGWYRSPQTGEPVERNFGEVVSLMHSELSEALEAHRKNLMDDKLPDRSGIEVEFADCIIRILDTAAAMGLDVPGAVIAKNRYNKTRADHKLEARAAGGKKY